MIICDLDDDTRVVLFSWEGGAWVDRAVIRLDELLPFHAPGEYEHGGDGFPPFQILHSYSDDENDLEVPMRSTTGGWVPQVELHFLVGGSST